MDLLIAVEVISLLSITSVGCLEGEFNEWLNDLTNHVIDEYFEHWRCVTFITDNPREEINISKERPVVMIRLNNDEDSENKLITESYEQFCGGYVIRVDATNRQTLLHRLLMSKRNSINSRYNNQRYILLPLDETDNDTTLLQDPDIFFFPNLLMITPDRNDSFSLLTHTVLDHHKHNVLGITVDTLDNWSAESDFETGSHLFPDKVRNVNGRKFVFALLNYSPFSLIWKEGNETFYDGFETRIAATFVEYVNGTWDGLDHPVELWGETFPNGTGTGIIGSVVEHKADFGYSAFYQWFCDDADCSYPFYQSDVKCLVPRPKLVSGWLTVVLPLAPDTWLALMVAYVGTSTFIFYILRYIEKLKVPGSKMSDSKWSRLSDALFTVFRLQLEQIPKIPKDKRPLAVYINISVFYYFFVAAFWQGGIASILTVPRYEEPINGPADMIERYPKFQWGSNSVAWVNSIKLSSDPNLVQIAQKFVVLSDDELEKRIKTQDYGFFIEKLPHGHYGYNDFIDEESMKYLRVMEDKIYSAFGVINLPKSSPFSELFDRTIFWMFDTGIVHKIEVQVSLERINNRLQNMIRISNEKDTSSVILAIRHIEGPLYIYTVGMLFATIVFITERYFL